MACELGPALTGGAFFKSVLKNINNSLNIVSGAMLKLYSERLRLWRVRKKLAARPNIQKQ